MSRLLGCCVCERNIEIWGWDGTNEFHREADGTGPYCDRCWTFIERIVGLEKVVKELHAERYSVNCHACAMDRPLKCEQHS